MACLEECLKNCKKFTSMDNEEINTGDTMSRTRAKEILRRTKNNQYSHYYVTKKEFDTARRIIKGE